MQINYNALKPVFGLAFLNYTNEKWAIDYSIHPFLRGYFATAPFLFFMCPVSIFDEFFKDRTGRIHYLLEFYSIDEEIIREYSKDAGASKTFIEEIVKASKRVPNFSMDYIQVVLSSRENYLK